MTDILMKVVKAIREVLYVTYMQFLKVFRPYK